MGNCTTCNYGKDDPEGFIEHQLGSAPAGLIN
jgi:hypothetical protein